MKTLHGIDFVPVIGHERKIVFPSLLHTRCVRPIENVRQLVRLPQNNLGTFSSACSSICPEPKNPQIRQNITSKIIITAAEMSTKESNIFPKSAFKHEAEIVQELTEDLQRVKVSGKSLEPEVVQEKVADLCSWMCKTPKSITYRVNTYVTNAEEIRRLISEHFQVPPNMNTFKMPEMIIVDGWDDSVELDLEVQDHEVIIDAACGAAVLRGAHIFAPGIIGMPHGLQVGDSVSVFADTSGNCRKGSKTYQDAGKIFLGNGIMEKTRHDLFDEGACASGIAVRITNVTSRLPQLGDYSVPKGHAVLQNPPSIICSRILDPQPGEKILDMCAAPGNKTTHLSALMKGEGTLVALEKIKSKIQRLKANCQVFACKNVEIHCFDSTKAVSDNTGSNEGNEPPFCEESFDRVLLDGPCSALGQRPQLLNRISLKELRSYVPLQRKLFSAAVRLLRVGGVLVYSTCTVTIAENEGIVAWALKNFPCLKLSSIREELESMGLDEKYTGSCGYSIDGLTDDEAKNLRRFGPESDTVGFFIARFIKVNENKIKINL